MSESPQVSGSGEISRFRAVVVAALRVKQLRRGSQPRIEPDRHKRKDTSIAMEEVRRGLITFTPFAAHDISPVGDLKGGIEESLSVNV